jgi:hypothetical protein
MKLYQTIAIFDVIVAAKDETDARETLRNWLHGYRCTEDPLAPNELVGKEIHEEREIRLAMRDAKPLVGEKLTEAEFNSLKSKTNAELFTKLYLKR